jgi:hypothetical protein
MLFLRFLSKIKGNGIQMQVRTIWYEMAEKEDLKICACNSYRESHTRAFYFLRKAPGWFPSAVSSKV